MPAPPGEINNLVDPYTQQSHIIAAIVVCLSVTATGVAIRTFTKIYVQQKMRIEGCETLLCTRWIYNP